MNARSHVHTQAFTKSRPPWWVQHVNKEETGRAAAARAETGWALGDDGEQRQGERGVSDPAKGALERAPLQDVSSQWNARHRWPQAHSGRVQTDTFRWIWMRWLGLQVQHELNNNSRNNTKHVLFWVLYTHLHLAIVHPHNSSVRWVLWIRALFKWGNYGTERLSALLNFAQHGNAGAKAQFRQSPEACVLAQGRTQRTGEQAAHQVNDDLTRPEQGLPQAWKPHSTWRSRGPEATELTLVTPSHKQGALPTDTPAPRGGPLPIRPSLVGGKLSGSSLLGLENPGGPQRRG